MRATGRLDGAEPSPRSSTRRRGGGAGHGGEGRRSPRGVRIADGYGEEEQKDYTVGAPAGEQEASAPYGGEEEGEMPPANKDPIAERSERVRHRVMADPTPDRVDEVIEEVLQLREKEEERRTRMAEQKAFRAGQRPCLDRLCVHVSTLSHPAGTIVGRLVSSHCKNALVIAVCASA